MKFLVVFAAIAAVAFGYPAASTWTLEELSFALQSPAVDPILKPYLEAALNEMMAAIMAGEQMTQITVAMPIVGTYNVNELAAAIQNPETNPAHIPYYEQALNELMLALHTGSDQGSITVVIPADLPVPAPESVIAAPEPVEIPIVPVEIPATPIEIPASPIEAPAAPVSSPLVQIIVNVQKQEQIADIVSPVVVAPVEAPEIIPTPVQVIEEAFVPEDSAFNPIDELHPVMPIVPIRPILPSFIPRPPAALPGFGPMI